MSGKPWCAVCALSIIAFVTVCNFLLPSTQPAEGQTVVAFGPVTDVPAPEFLIRTEKEVRGRHVNLEVDFSSVLSGGYVEVEIQLNKTGKSFIGAYVAKSDWELAMLDLVPWRGGDPHQTRRKTSQDDNLLVTFYRALARELDPSKRDPSVTERYPPIEVEAKVLGFAMMLGGFFPPDEYFEAIDQRRESGSPTRPDVVPQSAVKPLLITRLCEARGQLRTATFTIGSQTLTPSVKVGDPDSQCQGRCGIGCNHAPDLGHPRNYTQACLNHDTCARVTGGNFGECNGQFVAAANDFLSLLGCPDFIIGKWDVATNLGCDLTSNLHKILMHRNGTFSKCDGIAGTCILIGERVTLNHPATRGVCTGTLNVAGLRIQGTSSGPEAQGVGVLATSRPMKSVPSVYTTLVGAVCVGAGRNPPQGFTIHPSNASDGMRGNELPVPIPCGHVN